MAVAHAASRPATAAAAAPAAPIPQALPQFHVPEIVEDRRQDAAGNIILRRYYRGKLLGKGGFARCFLFTNNDRPEKPFIVAGKVVDKNSLLKNKQKAKLLAEIKIHRSLRHRYIVGFESFFEDRHNVYLMLELCSGQTLMELVKGRKRLSELEARYFAAQLLDAMRYLHGHAIIHRDLKLGNLFLTESLELRVGDFGLATQLEFPGERKRTVCGTPNYIAPEILESKDGHSFEVDVWAFGVIIYTMIIGRPPFETTDVKATYKRIKDNAWSFPPDAVVSPAARDLIGSILVPNPVDRPTIEEIARHPWFCAPDAFMPRRLPKTCLREAPAFGPGELLQGKPFMRELIAKPIGSLYVRSSKRSTGATGSSGAAAGAAGAGAGGAVYVDGPEDAPSASSSRRGSLAAASSSGGGADKENAAGGYYLHTKASSAAAGAAAASSAYEGSAGHGHGRALGPASASHGNAVVTHPHAGVAGAKAASLMATDARMYTDSAAAGGAGMASPPPLPSGGASSAGLGRASSTGSSSYGYGYGRESGASSAASYGTNNRAAYASTSGAGTPMPEHMATDLGAATLAPLQRASSAPTLPSVHTGSGGASSAASAVAGAAARRRTPLGSMGAGEVAERAAAASAGSAGSAKGGHAAAAAAAAADDRENAGSGSARPKSGSGCGSTEGSPSSAFKHVGGRKGAEAAAPAAAAAAAATARPTLSLGLGAGAATHTLPAHAAPLSSAGATPSVSLALPSAGAAPGSGRKASRESSSAAAAPSASPSSSSGAATPGGAASAGAAAHLDDTLPALFTYLTHCEQLGQGEDAATKADNTPVAVPIPTRPLASSPATPRGRSSSVSGSGGSGSKARRSRSTTKDGGHAIAMEDDYDGASVGSAASSRSASRSRSSASAYGPVDWHRRDGWASAAAAAAAATAPGGIPAVDMLHPTPLIVAERLALRAVKPQPPTAVRPTLWVTGWVDFSAKYGVGYMLSNAAVGVYFNDSTKIALSADGRTFEYIERHNHGRAFPATKLADCPSARVLKGEDGIYRIRASMERFPAELTKKVTLLRHFSNHLHEQFKKRQAATDAARTAARSAAGLGGGAGSGSGPRSSRSPGSAAAAAAADEGIFVAPALPGLLPCVTMEGGLPAAAPGCDVMQATGHGINGGVPVLVGAEEARLHEEAFSCMRVLDLRIGMAREGGPPADGDTDEDEEDKESTGSGGSLERVPLIGDALAVGAGSASAADGSSGGGGSAGGAGSGSGGAGAQQVFLPFVKKYVRSRRCMMFRLSNRSVQLFFYDGTQMLLSGDGRTATYTDRRANRFVFASRELLCTRASLTSRVPPEMLESREGAFAWSGSGDNTAAACAPAYASSWLRIVLDAQRRLKYAKDSLGQWMGVPASLPAAATGYGVIAPATVAAAAAAGGASSVPAAHRSSS